jgi:ferredoxin
MAKLIIDDKTYELNDGDSIIDACEEAGVPFSCQSGVCGTCQVDVVSGQDNLGPLNDEENDMGMNRNTRLACQCQIQSGTVRLRY